MPSKVITSSEHKKQNLHSEFLPVGYMSVDEVRKKKQPSRYEIRATFA
jgi:hypothetical protein